MVKDFFDVVVGGKEGATVVDKVPLLALKMLIESNEIAIGIRKQIGRVFRSEKEGTRANKGFNQSLSGGQHLFDACDDLILITRPLEEWSHVKDLTLDECCRLNVEGGWLMVTTCRVQLAACTYGQLSIFCTICATMNKVTFIVHEFVHINHLLG